MPLSTQVIRDGKPRSIKWGGFHVAAMAIAASCDDPATNGKGVFEVAADRPSFKYKDVDSTEEVPEAFRPFVGKDDSSYPDVPCPLTPSDAFALADYGMLALTPLNGGSYTLTRTHRFIDVTDGEIFELLPGDELRAWRN